MEIKKVRCETLVAIRDDGKEIPKGTEIELEDYRADVFAKAGHVKRLDAAEEQPAVASPVGEETKEGQ